MGSPCPKEPVAASTPASPDAGGVLQANHHLGYIAPANQQQKTPGRQVAYNAMAA